MEPQTFEIQIPFAGFYESIHSDEIARPLEDLPDYWCEYMPCDIPQKLMDMFLDAAQWGNAYQEYAESYAHAFIMEYLEGRAVYVAMESPKWYNFQTDRIFIKAPRHVLAKLWKETDKEVFDRICAERFTSRDGFRSFYRPNWREWGRLSTWDHNQLGALLLAHCETVRGQEWDQWAEWSLVEDLHGNGYLDQWLWDSPDADRPWKIFNYMRERQERIAA